VTVLGIRVRGTRGRSSFRYRMGEESEVSDSKSLKKVVIQLLRVKEGEGRLSVACCYGGGRFIGILAGFWRHLVVVLDLSIEHLDFEKAIKSERTKVSIKFLVTSSFW
jgi:hypothetical protein